MKNKDYKNKKLKEDLRRCKASGKKYLDWKLSYSQVEYIQELGYVVEPYLYEITTKTFFRLHDINESIIKEIHYKSKAGKRTYARKLNCKDKKVLKEYGVYYRVCKYRIYLNK